MKHMLLTCVVFLGLASVAQAQGNAVKTAAPATPSCNATPFGDTCIHTFGGVESRIPLSLGASCDGVEARLFQLSTRLAAPIGQPVAVSKQSCDAVALHLPEVRETTVFRVSLYKMESDKASDLQDILVQVYPNDLWDALTEWSQSNRLVVHDTDKRLIPALEQRHINYVSFTAAGGHTKQVCIWVPRQNDAAEEESPLDCDSLLVLHEKTATLPYIHVASGPRQIRTDVYMPILYGLGADPLVQKTFIDLVRTQL